MTLAVFVSNSNDFIVSDILARNIFYHGDEKVIYITLTSKDLILPAGFSIKNDRNSHIKQVTPLIDILQQSFTEGKFSKKKFKNSKHLKKVVEFFQREDVNSIFLTCANDMFSNIILELSSLQTDIPTVLKLLDIAICDNPTSKTHLKSLEVKDNFQVIVPSIEASLALFNRFPDIDKSIILQQEKYDKKSSLNIQLFNNLKIPSSDIIDLVFLNIRDFEALYALQRHILKMKAYSVKCHIIIPIFNYIIPKSNDCTSESDSPLLRMCQFLDRYTINNVKLIMFDNSMIFLNINDFQLYLDRFIFHSSRLLTLLNLFEITNLVHEVDPTNHKVKDVELMLDDEYQSESSNIVSQFSRNSIFRDVDSVTSRDDTLIIDEYDSCPCSIS